MSFSTSILARLALLAALAAGPAFAQPASVSTGTAQPATRPSYAYTQDNLLADLARQISDRYRASGDVKVELLRPWTAPEPASEQIVAEIVEAPANLASNLLLRVKLVSGQTTVCDTSLLVRVQLIRDVWATRTPVERGDFFNPTELDTRQVDVLRERDTVAAAETNGELTYTRAVPAGRLLCWRDVAKRSLVRRGEVIEVAAVEGALSITMKALAMQDGSAGDTVRVRNLDTRKEFSALVVAESRAQVRF
ncbi:flagella basal body P-ring formation protein FlgA [Opitutaceae bacterium EW11]|nr:flagella basal body P-ring formation protein FlgA [Opitutaceae bacterium EW11]